MMQPWDNLLEAFGLRQQPGQPRQLVGALNQPPQPMPRQPPGTGMRSMNPQLANMLGYAASSMAGLSPSATTGQALAALGGGLMAGKLGSEEQERMAQMNEARLAQAVAAQEQAMSDAQTKAAQAAEWEQYLATLPPETQQVARVFGPTAGVLDRIAPKPENTRPQVIGSQETGFYEWSPGQEPRQILAPTRRSPAAVVNVGPGETEYDKARGKAWADRAAEISAAARSADEQLASLGPLMASLANPDVYQGTGGAAVSSLKRFGRTMLGLDFEGVGDADVVRTVGNQMALSLRTMMPGTMTDADRQFLQSLPPNLSNSREGNILIGEFFRRSAARALEMADKAREYEARNGRLDAGFDREWAEYSRANPMFDEGDYQAMQEVARAAPQPSPLAGIPPDIAEILDRYGSGSN